MEKTRYIFAGLMRYWLIQTEYAQIIANRVEISTPLNSWRRLIEGVHLYDQGIDPYHGDVFHETPIMLVIFHRIMKMAPWFIPILFTMCDVLTGYLLYLTAEKFMSILEKKQETEKETYAKDSEHMLLDKNDFRKAPIYVATAYLFNPYTILTCVGLTTTVFNNMFMAIALHSMVNGRRVLSCMSLALATHQALYPVTMIVPAAIFVAESKEGCAKCSYIRTFLLFGIFWTLLIYLSAFIMDGSFNYIDNTYGFILTVPDLKPNIGLFWYFFTEMFEHFRLLFICALQINALILYVIPLTVRFRYEPMLLATTLLTLAAIFRSYPCLGDVAFYLALFPLWRHLFPYMQQRFIIFCFMVASSVLGPVTWHLWIYSRSANANFFFGVTLAFATAQIFFLVDFLFAYIKREYTLVHGTSRVIKGTPAKLVLL